MAKFNAASYAKNVAKSSGYISVNILKGLNPTMTNFITSNASSIKEMYENVKEFKHTAIEKIQEFKDSEYGQFAKDVAGNALEDLKTGKWYNKDRENRIMDDYMKSQGFDFDDDMDAGFNWDETDTEKASDSDTVTASTVTQVGNQIAIVSASASEKSANYISKTTRLSTRALLNQNVKSAGMLNTSLAAINTSIMNLHQDLVKPLNDHITNSTNFYKTATDQLAKQTAYLENINKILTDRYGGNKKNSFGSGSKNYWRALRGDDLPSLDTISQIVKDNIKNKSSDISMLTSMLGMFTPDMLNAFKMSDVYHSPIAAALAFGGNALFNRTAWAKGLQRTNKTLKNAFSTLLVRNQIMNKGSFGPLGFLANFFDFLPKPTRKFNTANYEKGRVDWTGMDAKALREVIPTQLAKIASALTGEEPLIFNYNTGRWETTKTKANNFNRARRSAIAGSISEFKSQVSDAYKDKFNLNSLSKSTESFERDVENLMVIMASHDIRIVDLNGQGAVNELKRILKEEGFLGRSSENRRYMIDERHFDQLMKILNKNKSMKLGFTPAVMDARSAAQDFSEGSGTANSGYDVIRNGSGLYRGKRYVGQNPFGNAFLSQKDNKGHNIFFYLQNYYSELKRISHLIELGGGRKGRRNKRAVARSMNLDDRMFDVPTDEGFKGNIEIQRYPFGSGEYISPEDKSENEKKEKEGFGKWAEDAVNNNKILKAVKEIFTANDKKRTIFDKFNDQLAELIYGQDKGKSLVEQLKDKGLSGILSDMQKNITKGIKQLAEEIRNAWKTIKEGFNKFFNETKVGRWIKGKFDRVAGTDGFQRMKNTFTNAGKWVKGSFIDTYRNVKSGFAATIGARDNTINSTGMNSRGGQVLKSGLVSVSEGEMIIPSEYNPYYLGSSNKSHQRAIESMNKRAWMSRSDRSRKRFWGSFSKGSDGVGDHKYNSKILNAASTVADVASNVGEIAADAAKEEAKALHMDIIESISRYRATHEAADEVLTDMENAAKYAANKIKNVADTLYGTKAVQDAKKGAQSIWSEIKPFLPESIAGGTIGSLVGGAITGSPIGLLAGFVVGSGVSLANNSEKVSNFLFGEKDNSGEYQGGLLNKQISNFLKKRFPKAAKSGVVGSVMNALVGGPGGLLGGFIIGAGLDLVSTTTGFKDIMFGHEGVDGKRRGGIVGSLQLHVVKPLADYVTNGLKSLDNYFKKNFLDPIGRLFNPLADWAKGIVGKSSEWMKDQISQNVVKPFAEKFDTLFGPLTQAAGWVGKKALGAAGNVASAPFKLGGKVGDVLKLHNIKAGYSSLSPQERMKYHGVGGFIRGKVWNNPYNRWAAQASDEEIQQARYYVMGDRENRRAIANLRQNMSDTLSSTLSNGGISNPKLTKELRNIINSDAVKNGDATPVLEWINQQEESGNFDKNLAEQARKFVDSEMEKINSRRADNANFKQNREEWMKKRGLDLNFFKKYSVKNQLRIDDANISKRLNKNNIEALSKAKEVDDRNNKFNQQIKENPVEGRKIEYLEKIANYTGALVKQSTGIDPSELDKNPNSGFSAISDNMSNTSKILDKNNDVETRFEGGHVVRYVRNANGEMEPDIRDSSTKAFIEEAKEDREMKGKLYDTFIGKDSIFHKLVGGLFGKKDAFDEDKKKKPGLLSKAAGFLGKAVSGVGGILGGIASAIGSIPGIGTAAKGLAGLGIAGLGLNWLNDHPEIRDKIGEMIEGLGKTIGDIIFEHGPKFVGAIAAGLAGALKTVLGLLPKSIDGWFQLVKDVGSGMKEGYDTTEDFLRGRDPSTYKEGDYMDPYMSDRFLTHGLIVNAGLKGQAGNKLINILPGGKLVNASMKGVSTARNAALNAVDSKVGKTIAQKGSNAVLKAASKTGSGFLYDAAEKGFGGAVKDVAGNAIYNLGEKTGNKFIQNTAKSGFKFAVSNSLEGAASKMAVKSAEKGGVLAFIQRAVSKVLNKVAGMIGGDAAKKTAEVASKEIAQSLAAEGGEKLAKSLVKNTAFMFKGFFALNAVTVGWQDAASVLGIIEDPENGVEITWKERAIAAIISGLNELIPGIGGIIPNEVIASIIINVLQMLGWADFSDLFAKREQSQALLQEYNTTNGTTYSIREYNKNVLGDYTIQERIGGGLKKIGGAAKDAFTGVKNKLTDAWEAGKENWSKNLASAKEGLSNIGTGIKNAAGSVKDKLTDAWEAGKENWSKNLASAKEGLSNIGTKVSETASKLVSGAKDTMVDIGTIGQQIMNKAKTAKDNGDLKALFTISADTGDANGLAKIVSGMYANVFKYTYALPTAFNALKNTISDIFKSIKEMDVGDTVKKLWEYSDPSKHETMDGYDQIVESAKNSSGEGIFGGLNSTIIGIIGPLLKGVVSFVRPFRAVGNAIGDAVDWVQDNASSVGNVVSNGIDWVKGLFTGSGSGVHVSQKGSNKKFGNSTVDRNGCGPAVAASTLRAYGKNINLNDAVDYATANGYVAGSSGVGTRASYFGDILGKNGIKTSYTNSNSVINKAVGSGNPTVLLGQDSKNTSKSNSPFGPNPHYVLARGTDSRGNVLVDDPELDRPALYNKSILKNAKLGIMTGGDSELLGSRRSFSNAAKAKEDKKKSTESTDIIGRKGLASDKKIAEEQKSSQALSTTTAEAINLDGDYIGKWVKQYESGSKGSSAISSGSGDRGGVSFGSYQFPSYKQSITTEGNLPAFWNKYYASQYPGVQPGNNQKFKDAWLSAVNKDPSGFFNNEHSFVASQYYAPIASKLQSNGVGDPTTYDRAAQEAAWSTSVQYGPGLAADVFKNAGINNSMNPVDYINKLYDYKYNNVDRNFKSSSKSVRDGIRNRFNAERQIMLGLAGKNPIDPNTVSGAVSGTSGFDATSANSNNSSGFSLDSILDNIFGKVISNVASKIGGVAGSILGLIFGNGNSSGSSGSTLSLSSGSNTQQENSIMQKVSEFLGYKMNYSQNNRYDYKYNGHADCSSTVQGILKQSIGVDPGGDTGAQIVSSKGRVVDVNNGSGPNESNLRPGDLLFYKRSSSSKPKGVGHVEMYVGNGQRVGHGGSSSSPYGLAEDGKHGRGPFPSSLNTDSERYLEAHRFTTADTNSSTAIDTVGTGSGIPIYNFTDRKYIDRQYRNMSGGATGLNLNNQLAQKMIAILTIIAENTAYDKYIPEIIQALSTLGNNMVSMNRNTTPKSKDIQENIDTNMARVISQLDMISQSL